MAVDRQGWVLHIVRSGEQSRGDRRRTIGTYQVYHDKVASPDPRLSGTSVEAKGPGDNKVNGNGRCVELGDYPLGAQGGVHYKTIGYIVSDDCDQTPKPALELVHSHTGARTEILVHPGHGFLASIGCINLTEPLASGSVDIPFIDSRERVIAAINDLKAFLGNDFPGRNELEIPKAWVVIDEA